MWTGSWCFHRHPTFPREHSSLLRGTDLTSRGRLIGLGATPFLLPVIDSGMACDPILANDSPGPGESSTFLLREQWEAGVPSPAQWI